MQANQTVSSRHSGGRLLNAGRRVKQQSLDSRKNVVPGLKCFIPDQWSTVAMLRISLHYSFVML